MAIRIPTSDQSKIFLGSQQIGAVYVGANKVWPDAPTEQFKIVHTKQTSFTITLVCSSYNLVTINWGDGTSTIVNNSTAKSHTYSSPGTFTVTITGDLTKITEFTCNNQLASSIVLVADCINISTFNVQFNVITSLDLSFLTKLTTFNCTWMASLTSLTMPTSVINTSTRNYYMNNTGISSYCNPIGATTFNYFNIYSCPNITNLNLNSLISCYDLTASTCPNLASVNISNLTSCHSLYLQSTGIYDLTTAFSSCVDLFTFSCPNLTNLNLSSLTNCSNLNTKTCTNLAIVNIDNLKIGSINASACTNLNPPTLNYTSIGSINLQDDYFTQSEVDGVLSNCLTISNSDASCVLNLGGNNAKPSTSGYATKAALTAKGWTVTTN